MFQVVKSWPVLLLFAGCLYDHAFGERPATPGQIAESDARKAYEQLMDAKTEEELLSLRRSWRVQFSNESQHLLLSLLVGKLQSTKSLPITTRQEHLIGFEGVSHDLAIEGGRAAWGIQILLERFCPVSIRGDLTREQRAAAVRAMCQYVIEGMQLPEAVRRLDLPLARRLELAKSNSTDDVTLCRLTHDPHLEVRRALVDNPKTPTRALFDLSLHDPDDGVRDTAGRCLLRRPTGSFSSP